MELVYMTNAKINYVLVLSATKGRVDLLIIDVPINQSKYLSVT